MDRDSSAILVKIFQRPLSKDKERNHAYDELVGEHLYMALFVRQLRERYCDQTLAAFWRFVHDQHPRTTSPDDLTLDMLVAKIRCNVAACLEDVVLNPLISRVEHSCNPTVFMQAIDRGLTLVTQKQIDAGTKFTLWYSNRSEALIFESSARQRALANLLGFTCDCGVCTGHDDYDPTLMLLSANVMSMQKLGPLPPNEQARQKRVDELVRGILADEGFTMTLMDMLFYGHCIYCGTKTQNLFSCAHCMMARYCDKRCQALHCKHHKLWCRNHPHDPRYPFPPNWLVTRVTRIYDENSNLRLDIEFRDHRPAVSATLAPPIAPATLFPLAESREEKADTVSSGNTAVSTAVTTFGDS